MTDWNVTWFARGRWRYCVAQLVLWLISFAVAALWQYIHDRPWTTIAAAITGGLTGVVSSWLWGQRKTWRQRTIKIYLSGLVQRDVQ